MKKIPHWVKRSQEFFNNALRITFIGKLKSEITFISNNVAESKRGR